MLNKITLILFKYIPAICIVGILLNNSLYFFIEDDSTILFKIPYILDSIIGISFIQILLLFLISYKFQYCVWHRILILNCTINLLLACMDAFQIINIEYVNLMMVILFVIVGCCCAATIVHLIDIKKGYKLCISRHGTSSQFDQFLIGFIKWIPFVQLFFCLLSNLIQTIDGDIRMCYAVDFSAGNSYLFTLFLFCLSLRLGFPDFHRWFIIANTFNLTIAVFDANIYSIPNISDMQFYLLYYIAPCICLVMIFSKQIMQKLYEHKTQIA